MKKVQSFIKLEFPKRKQVVLIEKEDERKKIKRRWKIFQNIQFELSFVIYLNECYPIKAIIVRINIMYQHNIFLGFVKLEQESGMLKQICLSLLICQSLTITFPLISSRQTCLYIKQSGTYELEYIVSGQNPGQYTCTIHSGSNVIDSVTQATEYERVVEFTSDNNKICFATLDDQMKQVSFDIISTQDPLKDHFSVKDEEETHLKMFGAFQELQRVYRDQSMFIERNVIYQNVLFNKEMKILFALLFKTVIAIILGGYQLLLVKEIINKKTYNYSLPAGIQDNDSDEDME